MSDNDNGNDNEPYTKKNIFEKRVTSYLTYFMFISMIFYQIYSLNSRNRILYLFMTSLAITALVYESTFIGCTANNCTLDRNRKTVTSLKQKESFACQESNRVNWRRAYLISFIPFVVMNSVTSFETNLLMFMLMLFITYFYFNFDSYHRSYLACTLEKKDKNITNK